MRFFSILSFCISLILIPLNGFSQSYNQVIDIAPGSSGTNQFVMGTINGNQLLYVYNESNGENQIWVTDGTEANTTELLGYSNFGFELPVYLFLTADNKIFFYWSGDDAIYSFDGQGITLVAANVEVYRMTWFDGSLYFLETGMAFGTVFLKATSDPNAPEMIADVASPNMQGVTVYNGQMILMAGVSGNMTHLFTSDGTTAGTVPFIELGKDSNVNWAVQFTEHNGTLYFYYQSNNVSAPVPVGFYKTDGTANGTVRLADMYNLESWFYDKFINRSVWHNGVLYTAGFVTDLNSPLELWTSDGTVAGTNFVKNLNGLTESSDPKDFLLYNNEIYFTAKKANGKRAIWRTDGTDAGTNPILENVFSGSDDYYGDWLTVYDGKLTFGAYTDATGSELWFSDGTDAGTISITDESAASENDYQPRRFYVEDNLLFFTAKTSASGRELWIYDNGMAPASIAATSSNVDCDDNSSPDMTDDFLTFDLNAVGTNTSASFNISSSAGTPSPSQGNYNQNITVSLPAGSAGNGNVTVTITDAANSAVTSSLTIVDTGACSTVGNEDLEKKLIKVAVMPNPFSEKINFQIQHLPNDADNYFIQITNISGTIIQQFPITKNSTIEISGSKFPTGLLMYQVVSEKTGEIFLNGKMIKR